MVVKVHGTRSSRSPLVNWYLEEKKIPYEDAPPRPSAHPFGQVPFLVDGDVEVFESGAILLYLADKYDAAQSTAEDRAKYTQWVVWANSSLDPVCFVENDRGGVVDTRLDRPGRSVLILEKILSERPWLVDDDFSVADVAVASYLNYVPLFFPEVDLSASPNIAAYMEKCATRDAFRAAFGQDHVDKVLGATERAAEGPSSSGGNKKILGIF